VQWFAVQMILQISRPAVRVISCRLSTNSW
jgi:hypothetical protein